MIVISVALDVAEGLCLFYNPLKKETLPIPFFS